MIIFSHCGERLETGSDWSSTEIEGNKQENIYRGGREGSRLFQQVSANHCY